MLQEEIDIALNSVPNEETTPKDSHKRESQEMKQSLPGLVLKQSIFLENLREVKVNSLFLESFVFDATNMVLKIV